MNVDIEIYKNPRLRCY